MNILVSVKKFISAHFLPFLLAVIMLLSCIPLNLISVVETVADAEEKTTLSPEGLIYDYDTLKIIRDGVEISELSIYSYEKISVEATGLTEKADYQWQIRHPERAELWIDIYDGTESSIDVTAALIKSAISQDGTAALRCRAVTSDYAYLTSVVTVTLLSGSEPVAPVAEPSESPLLGAASGSAEDPEHPEFVTVTINYEKYEYHYNSTSHKYELQYMGPAFSPYIATLKYNSPFPSGSPVSVPTVVGFQPTLVEQEGAEMNGNQITITLGAITEDVVYTVKYLPAPVNYEVRYLFQNIYDDMYVTNTAINDDALGIKNGVFEGKGYTGLPPTYTVIGDELVEDRDTKKGVLAEFHGFTALYYQPDTIAADGSTIFEVYYERNYYLMEFDCDGGYGAHTIYVRHGTYIYVPTPTKMGYVLNKDTNGNYWDLVKTDDPNDDSPLGEPIKDGFHAGDGYANELPAVMPAYNTAYKALWTTTETTYTVVYWIDNGDGTKTYIGSRPVGATSGDEVSGSDDLTADMYVCGMHIHTDACIDCSITEHIHNSDCVVNLINLGSEVANPSDKAAMEAADMADASDSNPDSVYLYFIQTETDKTYNRYWPKISVGGTCYNITVEGNDPIDSSTLNSIVDGEKISEATVDGYTAYKYKAKTNCGIVEHSHVDSCYICNNEKHTHSDACKYADASGLEFVEADQNKMVEGDASTVVNVVYKYKTFTIRYIYARKRGNDYQIATLTRDGQLNNCQWDSVGTDASVLPTFVDPNGKTERSSVEIGSYTYYYISLTAKFGSNIASIWPSAAIGNVTYGNTTYNWGSWGAEYNSGYRQKYGNEHANIVGPYPTMSLDMLVPERNEKLDDGTYLAQNMVAWWGSGQGIEAHAYHSYFQVSMDEAEDPNATYKIVGDKKYILKTDVFTAAHNGDTRVDPVVYTGYTIINEDKNKQANSSNYRDNPECPDGDDADHNYCSIFYYDRSIHTLSFVNYNTASVAPVSNQLMYAESLEAYQPSGVPAYPDGLEPGAYEFGGWYTTPECYKGTEVNWSTLTMPDGDLTVYAKWTPIVRNVYFHLLYTDINYDDVLSGNLWYPDGMTDAEKADYYPIKVPHGELLVTTYSHTPTRDGEYQFIGWFYFDENGKKKYAPDSMKVTRDLILFAEWHSTIPTKYKVEYKAYNYVDGGAGDTVIDSEIGLALDDYSTAGKTVTFNAKGGAALYDKTASGGNNYQNKWFPDSSSHSILMEQDSTLNTHVFKYYNKDYINYKVMYINRINGTILGEKGPIRTENAIVTERFCPFEGFIPEEYYIEHPVAYDPVDYSLPGNANHVSDENIIYFYYVPDTEHALHRIEHHFQNVEDDEYTLYTADQGPHDIGELKKADVLKKDGLELVRIDIYTYELNADASDWIEHIETINVDTEAERNEYITNGITRKVTLGGLGIKFYYDRIKYPYIIKFINSTDSSILGYGMLDSAGNVSINTDGTQVFTLENVNDGKGIAKYEAEVTYTAPSQIKIGNAIYNLNGEAEKSKKIFEDTAVSGDYSTLTENIIEFYYLQKQVNVHYLTVCHTVGAVDYGAVDMNKETVALASNLAGAKAYAGKGYRFVGWYTDAACTVKVNDAWVKEVDGAFHLKPGTLDATLDDIYYYALFEPICGSMQITKSPASGTALDGSNFLFRIKGQGKLSFVDMLVSINGAGSVIIKELPIGDYTVTELTSWSWEYDIASSDTAKKDATVTEGARTNLSFTNKRNDSNWLSGETNTDNIFEKP